MLNNRFDWDEVDSLITLLHAQGISYLMGNGSSMNEDDSSVAPVHLIQRLAACGYPLVENSSISLFILHSELDSSVVQEIQCSEGDLAEYIQVVVFATIYLQHWWNFCTIIV